MPAGDQDHQPVTVNGHDPYRTYGFNGEYTGGYRWEKSMIAFSIVKAKVVQTPVLRHFDPDRPPGIVNYANK